MKTQLLSITNLQNQLEILVLLGEISRQYRFIVKKNQIKDSTLLTFVEDQDFSETFRFNDHIAIEITNLVKKFYQGEKIDFPINLGDYDTDLIALSQQENFDDARKITILKVSQ